MLNICIGFDRNEPVAYHVLCHSILRRASKPVCITPIYLPQLRAAGTYTRAHDPLQSTEFTYSRFLTPWLCGKDPCIFMDSDMLCLTDIHEVLDHCIAYKDVYVVQHDYTPHPGPKFLGQEQTSYPCKNWSSFMVFNPQRCAVSRLTPSYINTASAADLHRFRWCRDAADIGSLPLEWNHLVGEYSPNPNAKIVHFTRGGPWFTDYHGCEFSDQWWDEWENATSVGNLKIK